MDRERKVYEQDDLCIAICRYSEIGNRCTGSRIWNNVSADDPGAVPEATFGGKLTVSLGGTGASGHGSAEGGYG